MAWAWIDKDRAKRIQTYLKDQGVYDGKIDSKLGKKSEKAIYALKGDNVSDVVTDGGKKETLTKEKVSDDYWWKEFKCHNGTDIPDGLKANIKLLVDTALQPARTAIEAVIDVVSGHRTREYDEGRGYYIDDTMHYHGGAADIKTKNMVLLGKILKAMYDKGIIGGLIFYKDYIHVDIRNLIPYKNKRYSDYKDGFKSFEDWRKYQEAKGRG